MKLHTRTLALLTALTALTLATPVRAERYLVHYEPDSKSRVIDELRDRAVIHHEFDDIRVVAATMPALLAGTVASVAGVVQVTEDAVIHRMLQETPYGIDLVRARDVWDADRDGVIDPGAPTGAGIRLCIVDSGIDAGHEDLGGGGVTLLAGRSWTGESWFEDGNNGHGTHVAGTAAAANNDRGVVGVSPGTVELLIADVFASGGAHDSTVLAAVQWCADQGAHVVNLSLGGGGDALAAGYEAVYDRGVMMVAAAGNTGGPAQSFPASYAAVVSVAAVDDNGARATFSSTAPQVELAAPGDGVLSTWPVPAVSAAKLTAAAGPTWSGAPIDGAGIPGTVAGPLADGGRCSTLPAAGAFTGAIVLCERGDVTFAAKINNAAHGGAAGVAIFNNVPGFFIGTCAGSCTGTTPALSLSQADGQAALAFVSTQAGLDIFARKYSYNGGTSMASPHAAGAAAVLWSACPELSNDQVRAHLAATVRESQSDTVPGRDESYGYGIVNLKAAVDALSDGIDEYDPQLGNASGSRPANVECPAPLQDGTKTTGGGWLNGNGRINFGFNARLTSQGPSGELELNDKGAGVRIHLGNVSSLARLSHRCGPVAAGPASVEFTGEGTLNSEPASFRVCVTDNGEPGKGSDVFYLECAGGCSYDTTSSGADGILAGGNIQTNIDVRSRMDEPAPHAHPTALAGRTGDLQGEPASASTVILGPVLLDRGVPGALQVLTAQAFDANQGVLAGAEVWLAATRADGSMETFRGVTGATGRAVFTLVLPEDSVEYQASASTAQSNWVSVQPD